MELIGADLVLAPQRSSLPSFYSCIFVPVNSLQRLKYGCTATGSEVSAGPAPTRRKRRRRIHPGSIHGAGIRNKKPPTQGFKQRFFISTNKRRPEPSVFVPLTTTHFFCGGVAWLRPREMRRDGRRPTNIAPRRRNYITLKKQKLNNKRDGPLSRRHGYCGDAEEEQKHYIGVSASVAPSWPPPATCTCTCARIILIKILNDS